MSKWIRKGDLVVVMRGKDRGKTGEVLSRKKQQLWIAGINIKKKCVKKSQEHPKGAILEVEAPLDASNVAIAVEDKPIKLRARINEKGSKELYYIREGEKVVYRLANRAK